MAAGRLLVHCVLAFSGGLLLDACAHLHHDQDNDLEADEAAAWRAAGLLLDGGAHLHQAHAIDFRALVRSEAVPSLQALLCDMHLWWCRLHPPVYASPHLNKPFIAEVCIPDSPSDPSSLNMVSHLLLPSLLTAVCASSSYKSSNSLMGWSRGLTPQRPHILWRH